MKSKIFAILLGLMSSVSVMAQLIPTTAYYMDKNPKRHLLNPAFHPTEKFYIGMPALSLFNINVGNDKLAFEDIFQPRTVDGKNTTVLFLNKAWENGRQDFMKTIGDGFNINTNFNIQLLDFGFRIKPIRSYISFDVNTCVDMQIFMPKSFLESTIGGGIQGDNEMQSFGFNDLYMGMNAYTAIGLGYTIDVNDRLSVGVKGKYLFGHAAFRTDFKDLQVNMGKEKWEIVGDADVVVSMPGLDITSKEDGTIDEFGFNFNGSDFAKPAGKGFAVDLGASFKILDNLNVSASVLDLGVMNYTNHIQTLSKGSDFVFDGIEYDINAEDMDFGDYFEPYKEMLQNMYHVNHDRKSFKYGLKTKFLAGVEYGVWKNKMTFGLLYKGALLERKYSEDLMFSANFKPWRVFSMSFSYSFFDGRWSNLGTGINFNFGALNWFLIADQIPLRYAKGDGIMIPTRTQYFNLATGFNFAIRAEEDKHLRRKAREAAKAESLADSLGKITPVAPVEPVSPAPVVVDTPKVVVEPVSPAPVVVDTPKVVVEPVAPAPVVVDTPKVVVEPVAPAPVVVDTPKVVVEPQVVVKDTTPKFETIELPTKPIITVKDTTPVVKPVEEVKPIEKVEPVAPVVVPADTVKKEVVVPAPAEESKAADEEGELIVEALRGIQFSNVKGEMLLLKVSYPILDKVAERMLANPNYSLEIKGHYFLAEDGPHNRFYGKERAMLVKSYLIEKGVSPSKIDIEGVGAAYPEGPVNTLEQKKKNNRMELRLFK